MDNMGLIGSSSTKTMGSSSTKQDRSNDEFDGNDEWPTVHLLNTSATEAAKNIEEELRQKYKFEGDNVNESEQGKNLVVIGTKCGSDNVRDTVHKCLKDGEKEYGTRRILLFILQDHQDEQLPPEAVIILHMGYIKREELYLSDPVDSALREIILQTRKCEKQNQQIKEDRRTLTLLTVSQVQLTTEDGTKRHKYHLDVEVDFPYISMIDALLREISSLTYKNESENSTISYPAQPYQMRSVSKAGELSACILTPDNSNLTNKFEEAFKDKMKRQGVSVQRLQSVDTIKNNEPLFVVCNYTSRSQADLNFCLKQISGVQHHRMILVGLHTCRDDDYKTNYTRRFLNDSPERHGAFHKVIDMAYVPGEGMYQCKMNDYALQELEECLENLKQDEKKRHCIVL